MQNSYTLQGGKELAAKLRQLPESVNVSILRRAGMKYAKPIVNAAKASAPEDTGRLRLSVRSGSRYIARDGTVRIMIGLIKLRKSQLKKLGITDDAYYGLFVEKGTKFQKAQNWLLRSFDESVPAFLDGYMPELKSLVEKITGK